MRKLVLLALMLFPTELALAQRTLTVVDVSGDPGAQVIVPVQISDGEGIVAIQFDLGFDQNLLIVPEENSVLPGSAITDHSLGSSQNNGKLRIVAFSSSLSSLAAGPGTLVQVVFRVSGTTPPGSQTTLELSGILASDSAGNALEVSGQDGELRIGGEPNSPGAGQNQQVFAQIANGSFPGGSFAVTMVFVNLTEAESNGRLSLFLSDGSPFQVTSTEGQTGSSFDFELAAGGSVFFATDGTGDFSPGYAVLAATGPLGGTLVFTYRSESGVVLSEAGVGASAPGRYFVMPILLERGRSNTGVALVNPSGETVSLVLIRRDQDGREVERTDLELPPRAHLPRFGDELFPELAGLSEFQGSVEILASAPVAAVALKQQGLLLTTFPVIPL